MSGARSTLVHVPDERGVGGLEYIKEVSISDAAQDAAEVSSSLQRAPGKMGEGFVRGKVGFQPFRPGGLTDNATSEKKKELGAYCASHTFLCLTKPR
jgi:hypothetical protein